MVACIRGRPNDYQNSQFPQAGPEAISNFTSAVSGWQVVRNDSHYKHSRWQRPDTAYKHRGTVSDAFCCLLYHHLWWLAGTLVSAVETTIVFVWVYVSATVRPSQYLFKAPELCFSLTLPVYIGFTPHTYTHIYTSRHVHTHTNTHVCNASLWRHASRLAVVWTRFCSTLMNGSTTS